MATQQSTSIVPAIRIQPELILPRDPGWTPNEAPCPLFIRSGDCFTQASESEVMECARRHARAKFTIGSPVLKDKRVLYDFLLTHIGSRDNEVFAMLLLDCQMRLLEYVELFHGDPASSAVYPREVVKWVVATRATDVIIAHNHPTGDAEPSRNDLALTGRLRETLRLIEVRLHDHLIVGRTVTSLRECGRLAL